MGACGGESVNAVYQIIDNARQQVDGSDYSARKLVHEKAEAVTNIVLRPGQSDVPDTLSGFIRQYQRNAGYTTLSSGIGLDVLKSETPEDVKNALRDKDKFRSFVRKALDLYYISVLEL